jgi:hypothetical protein
MKPPVAPNALETAARGLLGAAVAKRDAYRLIRIGYGVAIEPHQAVVDAAEARAMTLQEAIVLCALKWASQYIDCHEHDVAGHTEARTADLAYAAGMKIARRAFRGGRCEDCKGPALPCARYAATHDRWCKNT